MKPLAKIAVLATLTALAYGCDRGNLPLAPNARRAIKADVTSEQGPQYGPWGDPVNLGPVVNSPSNDQHPAISKDGLSLYITSDRPGGLGGSDIWVSQRASSGDPWGAPENLGPNINSAGNDVAPN